MNCRGMLALVALLLSSLFGEATYAMQDMSCQPVSNLENASSPESSLLQLSQDDLRKVAAIKSDEGDNVSSPQSLKPGFRISEEGNLCMQSKEGPEHFVPEFVLLGAEKAATTTLWWIFAQNKAIVSPLNHGQPDIYKKELHFFNTANFDAGPSIAWPKCSQGSRQVTYDCSPTYLNNPEVPVRMSQFFGTLGNRIKLAAVLRNPIGRMHSAWHYYKNSTWHREVACPQVVSLSFQDYVKAAIAGQDPCRFLSTGNYAEQIERWFTVFDPSQFSIFLFKDVAAATEATYTAVGNIWKLLGLHGSPPKVDRLNHVNHRNLEQELDAATLLALQQHVGATMSSERVTEALIKHASRPTLVGYEGDFDKASVQKWIDESW